MFSVYISCYQCVFGESWVFKRGLRCFKVYFHILSIVGCFECIVECLCEFWGYIEVL